MSSSSGRDRANGDSYVPTSPVDVTQWIQVVVADGDEATSSSAARTYRDECRVVFARASVSASVAEPDGPLTALASARDGGSSTFTPTTPPLALCSLVGQSSISSHPSIPILPEAETIVEVDGHSFVVYQQLRATRSRNLIIAAVLTLFVAGIVLLPLVVFKFVIKKPT